MLDAQIKLQIMKTCTGDCIMYCQNCGEKINDKESSCPYCGSIIDIKNDGNDSEKKRIMNNRGGIIYLVALVFVAVCVLALYIYINTYEYEVETMWLEGALRNTEEKMFCIFPDDILSHYARNNDLFEDTMGLPQKAIVYSYDGDEYKELKEYDCGLAAMVEYDNVVVNYKKDKNKRISELEWDEYDEIEHYSFFYTKSDHLSYILEDSLDTESRVMAIVFDNRAYEKNAMVNWATNGVWASYACIHSTQNNVVGGDTIDVKCRKDGLVSELYCYDELMNLVMKYDFDYNEDGFFTQIIATDNTGENVLECIYSYLYDNEGRVLKENCSETWKENERLQTVKESRSYNFNFAYLDNNLSEIEMERKYESGTIAHTICFDVFGNELGEDVNKILYEKDSSGKIVSAKISYKNSDGVKKIEYDKNGNVSSVTDFDDREIVRKVRFQYKKNRGKR